MGKSMWAMLKNEYKDDVALTAVALGGSAPAPAAIAAAVDYTGKGKWAEYSGKGKRDTNPWHKGGGKGRGKDRAKNKADKTKKKAGK